MAIELIENSELGALAPSRLGNSFVGDEDYSNFTKLGYDDKIRYLKNYWDNNVNNAVNSSNCVNINFYLKTLKYNRAVSTNYGTGEYDAYSSYISEVESKLSNCTNNFRNYWSIDSSKNNDCDYLLQRAKSLADVVGSIAQQETNIGKNTDGAISIIAKSVFDNYAKAIKDANCVEKINKQEDASSEIKDIIAQRDKAKADEEARLKTLSDAKLTTTNTTTDLKKKTNITPIALSNNTKLFLGLGLGVAIITTILILRK
jgi:hypothetical protein